MSASSDIRRCVVWLRLRGSDALAQAVSTCRQAAGLIQQQLARRLNVNRTTVIDMEAGRNSALRPAAEALSLLGYDLLVVPRGAKVTAERH
jgi:transcriptional regulator with XRE-family HTH domain